MVDAEPLYVPGLSIPSQGTHNVLFVVTEHDSAYAFDADSGTQLWHASLLLTGETTSDNRNCGQVTPEIGITSTPVIDPKMGPHGTMYVVAMSKKGSTYFQRLHALDITTGAEEFSGPIAVQATYPKTSGTTTFDPKQYKDRAALLLYGGTVYTSWASHCDIQPYSAWIIGYNESNLQQVSVLDLTPNGAEGSVWQAGAGPAADTTGDIFVLLANGTFDTTLNAGGFPNSGDYGNGFVKVAPGGASVLDYFTMDNTVAESSADEDLGSGGAMLLPPLSDALGHTRNLAVGAGKDGNIYVVDQANMGKFNSLSNGVYQELGSAVGSVFSSPAWFDGTLYYGGSGDTLKAFQFSGGMFGLVPTSKSAHTFGYPGATPSISANGTTNGIVWASENTSPAVLHAFDASNLGNELYNSAQASGGRDNFGAGNKFIVPLVVNGKVYVGTSTGVGVFGLLSLVQAVSVAPASGTGSNQTFDFTFTDPAGANNISVVQTLVNSALTGLHGCYVWADVANSGLYLLNDSATAFLGPIAPGANTTLTNSQCAVNGAGSSIGVAGATLTLNLALTFTGGFAGAKSVYADASTGSGSSSGWQTLGSWTVPGVIAAPTAVSVSPGSGSGTSQTFAFTFADSSGASNISVVQTLVNSVFTGVRGCYLWVDVSNAGLYLLNDSGSAFLGPIAPGANSTLTNSQCAVNGTGSSIGMAGTTLTLNLALTFTSGFAGAKSVYADASTGTGLNSGWQTMGSWTVSGAIVAPSVVSVSPASGSGASQTFAFTFTDSSGANNISAVQVLVNSVFTGVGGCYVWVDAGNSGLYLLNDSATAFLGPIAPGADSTLTNSQCAVSGTASSIGVSGTTLTLNLALTFMSGFAGTRSVYADALTGAGVNSGWRSLGSWIVP